MRLRIVAGDLGGRYVDVPGGTQGLRPTQERLREAFGSMLSGRIAGARFADLCAGTGMMGFELLSRGARSGLFVESDRRRVQRLRRDAAVLNVDTRCTIVGANMHSFVRRCTERFDIVYYDPPYADSRLAALLPRIAVLVKKDGVLAYERSSAEPAGDIGAEGEAVRRTRTYGDTALDVYFFESDRGQT
jgi:16S rRNA (guanine(966)-N(2))-methyltransferase RsmD